MSPLIVMISSAAGYYGNFNLRDVIKIANITALSFPKDTLYLTGGVCGPAFDFATVIADLNGPKFVQHMIPFKGWQYKDAKGNDEYGIVRGCTTIKVGYSMEERLQIMAKNANVSIMLDGGLGSLEEALIVHKNGGRNMYFPWFGPASAILHSIKTGKGVPKPPSFMEDGYEDVIHENLGDCERLDTQVVVPSKKEGEVFLSVLGDLLL